MVVFEAERCNQAVDGFSNRADPGAKSAVVAGGGHGDVEAACLEDLKSLQLPEHLRSFVVSRQPLQDLADHQVQEAEALARSLPFQPFDLWWY